MGELYELPQKRYYRASEVCRYTDTQPYVLSFWESEFPQLSPDKSRGGQSMYTKKDIDLVMRIKELLYKEEYTIAGARQRLEQDFGGEAPAEAASPAEPKPFPEARPTAVPAPAAETGSAAETGLSFDSVPRDRYEDALDEIAHLRLQFKEAESQARRATSALARAEEGAARHKARAEKAIRALERLEELLG